MYAAGAEDFMIGCMPPPGTQIFIEYFEDYQANKLTGNNGGVKQAGPLGNIKFNAQVVADSLRYISVTKFKILGGDVLWNVIVPIVYQHASMSAGGVNLLGPGSTSETSVGDVVFGPGLAFHPSPTFHFATGVNIVAPTGQYNATDNINIGHHYWGINPLCGFTYIGGKDSPIPGFEVTSLVQYWFNTTNTETHYMSGQQFTFDYLVGQHFGKWAFGANGNYLIQTTNDQAGAINPDTGLPWRNLKSNDIKEFSLGPAIFYQFSDTMFMSVKWQNDLMAHNAPEGNHFWMKFVKLF
jgi:hypothetical protein